MTGRVGAATLVQVDSLPETTAEPLAASAEEVGSSGGAGGAGPSRPPWGCGTRPFTYL